MFVASKQFAVSGPVLAMYENLRGENSVLLFSGMNGRYSIAGFEPLARFEAYELPALPGCGQFEVQMNFEKCQCEDQYFLDANQVLDELDLFQKKVAVDLKYLDDGLRAWPFRGGMLGFFSYDFGVQFEEIRQTVRDDVGYPQVWFMIPRKWVIVDHEKEVGICAVIDADRRRTYDELASFENLLKIPRVIFQPDVEEISPKISGEVRSNLTIQQYLEKVVRVKEYLTLGHTYQVNFSQRFEMEYGGEPESTGRRAIPHSRQAVPHSRQAVPLGRQAWGLFKKVSTINPSPFQAYIEGEDFAVVSNSPERLVKVREGLNQLDELDKKFQRKLIVESRPIKGTMPRSNDPEQDQRNCEILLESMKDNAELTMIVDLVRNDIGKISKIGSVEVNEHRVLEKYSHVWHTVSNVRAELSSGRDFRDVLRALFPGGSITGCPKKRTMEIIDELEDFKRGVYTGSAGYIGFDGLMDLNIMIRTMFLKGGRVYFHSGGGIVMDSNPRSEYEETLHKAQAMRKSLVS